MQIPGEVVGVVAAVVGVGSAVVGAAWKIARLISTTVAEITKELGDVKITIARIDERVAAIEPTYSRRKPTEPPVGGGF